jgi:hypothetical protein
MPQPLSIVNPDAGIQIGNSWDSPAKTRPQLALLSMNVVAEFSILESFVSSLFVKMLGPNPGPAAAVFAAIKNEVARKDAFRAVAKTVLNETEMDLLEAVLARFDTAARGRNKVAHHVWGHSPAIPDGVLLCDPVVFTKANVEMHQYLQIIKSRTNPQARLESNPVRPEFPIDKIYVYYAHDFISMSEEIQKAMNFVGHFRHYLENKDHPRGPQLFDALSKMPEIQSFLFHQSERRKKNAEAP